MSLWQGSVNPFRAWRVRLLKQTKQKGNWLFQRDKNAPRISWNCLGERFRYIFHVCWRMFVHITQDKQTVEHMQAALVWLDGHFRSGRCPPTLNFNRFSLVLYDRSRKKILKNSKLLRMTATLATLSPLFCLKSEHFNRICCDVEDWYFALKFMLILPSVAPKWVSSCFFLKGGGVFHGILERGFSNNWARGFAIRPF